MKRLELLDYGRFSAALGVVLFHYTFNGIANGKIGSITHAPSVIAITKYGYLGVELFFMISGYVIFMSARGRSASRFAVDRAVRLYPAYWFSVLFTSYFAWHWGGELMSVHPGQTVANLSMLQSFAGIAHVDGVYWTLVYEITFYAGVFLLLLCGLRQRLRALFMAWPVLFCGSLLLGVQALPYLGGYYYYFAAGSLFAVLKEGYDRRAALGLLVTYVLCLHFSASGLALAARPGGVEYSPATVGLVITLFFVLFMVQNTSRAQSWRLPLSRTAGALTYPVYLIHAHAGYMFIGRWATEENKWSVYAFTVLLVLAVAYFVHKVIEERCSTLWERLFTRTVGRSVDSCQRCFSRVRSAYVRRAR